MSRSAALVRWEAQSPVKSGFRSLYLLARSRIVRRAKQDPSPNTCTRNVVDRLRLQDLPDLGNYMVGVGYQFNGQLSVPSLQLKLEAVARRLNSPQEGHLGSGKIGRADGERAVKVDLRVIDLPVGVDLDSTRAEDVLLTELRELFAGGLVRQRLCIVQRSSNGHVLVALFAPRVEADRTELRWIVLALVNESSRLDRLAAYSHRSWTDRKPSGGVASILQSPMPLEIPVDRKRGQADRTVRRVSGYLPTVTSACLRRSDIHAERKIALVVCAVGMLCSRYSGAQAVTIACVSSSTPSADDYQPDTYQFLKFEVPSSRKIADLVDDVVAALIRAEKLTVADLQATFAQVPMLPGSAWDAPLQVGVSFESLPQRLPHGVRPHSVPQMSEHELHWMVWELRDEVLCELQYREGLYRAERAQILLKQFIHVLEQLSSNMERELALVEVMSREEQLQQLVQWNRTAGFVPEDVCVHDLIADATRLRRDAIAIWDRGRQVTFEELWVLSNKLARALIRQGIGEDQIVGIYSTRCLDAVLCILAVLKTGAAYLPIDSSFPRQRVIDIIRDARATILIATEGNGFEDASIRVLDLNATWPLLQDESAEDITLNLTQNSAAFVLYTSGSTGQPKGVVVTHGNLVNYYYAWNKEVDLAGSVQVIGQMTFFAFAVFQGDVIRALCSGHKLVLLPQEMLLAPKRLFECIQEQKVDFVEFVPTILRPLVEYVRVSGKDLGFLRVIAVGADRWYFDEHKAVSECCGPNTKLIHVYGSTETTLDSTFFCLGNQDSSVSDSDLTPIGLPILNVQAYILDDARKPVPFGVVGELYIGGRGVAKGYLHRDDLTAQRFVCSPSDFPHPSKLFRTGDKAFRMLNGNIGFVGREDNQVKINGFRVELGEVEAAIRKINGVRDAVVRAVSFEQGTRCLAAYVLTDAADERSGDQVLEALRRTLPSYMIPTRVVMMQKFPLTPSGKVDRKAFPEIARETVLTADSALHERSDIPAAVLAVCKHVLSVSSIQVSDKLAQYGLDSMGMVNILTGIESACGIEISDEDVSIELFTTPHALVDLVERKLEQRAYVKSPNS